MVGRSSGLRFGFLLGLVLLLPLFAAPVAAQTSDADTVAFLIARARKHSSLHGPTAGALAMDGQQVPLAYAGVSLHDFYARAAFTSPIAGADHPWDVGFVFRSAGAVSDEAFRFILDSDGVWSFKEGLQAPIATGHVDGLANGAGDVTRIDLIAIGDVGYAAINGGFVTRLDLTSRDAAGDIGVGTGFYVEDALADTQTPYAEFAVWPL
jgi:hypothetical protein